MPDTLNDGFHGRRMGRKLVGTGSTETPQITNPHEDAFALATSGGER